MKKFLLLTCVSLICLLIACGNVSKEEDMKSEGKNNESKSDLVVEEELWNKEKDEKLEIFMQKWGKEMNQKYKKYTADSNLDYYGIELPKVIMGDSKEFEPTIGEIPITLKWSTTGKIEAGYSLLAVYSDVETNFEMSKHVYLFTLKSGIPKVLVTQASQTGPKKELVFHETVNKRLKDGYSNIIDSKADYEKEKYSFTKGERIDFLISEYDDLPNNGEIKNENDEIIYSPSVETTTESIQKSIDFVKELSNNAKSISSLIPVKIESNEIDEEEPALTVVDGEVVQANHLFGRVVQGFD